MITTSLRPLVGLSVVFGFVACAGAEVVPHALFCENAVLQRDKDVPLWGKASEGETVTVGIQGQKVSAVAKDGQWKVVLKPLSVGGPYEMAIAGDKTDKVIGYKNILVGDV